VNPGAPASLHARYEVLDAARQYARLRRAIAGLPLPVAIVDLDILEANAHAMLARANPLPIRLGSKSIRCVEIMRHAQRLSPRFQGLLCYSAREAAWLAQKGFDDLLIAYPTVDRSDLDAVAQTLKKGVRVTLMVDDAAQLGSIVAAARARGAVFRLAIDLDLSSSFGPLHFGVRRSPVTTPEQALALARRIAAASDSLQLVGLMGYEAQIAGLQDAVPGQALRSGLVRWLKRRSLRELTLRRVAAVNALRIAGFNLEFVNGGGTGSLEATAADPAVSEAAAGSGLYAPTLFDHFQNFRHTPALFFALQVVRHPAPGIVTCAGGGYIASGPGGTERLPTPILPEGTALLRDEGAGEVQTPVRLPPHIDVAIGEPVFFRHAKAGEVAERFERFVLIRGGAVIAEAPTYRGEGQCFF
jgi:D-serine deaminase-like pyridoxal phosphate-dependent protein